MFWALILIEIAGVLIAAFLTVAFFLKDFYEIRSNGQALLWLGSFCIPPLSKLTTVTIKGGEIATPGNAAARIGGPGYAVIMEDSAAVFEQYGRFTRILGPGYYKLSPYERVRGTVDLRPQTRKVRVRGFTRDGMPMEGEVEIEYQIRQLTRIKPEGASRPSRRFRSFYTFSWEAILKAVYDVPARDGNPLLHGEVVGSEVAYQFQRILEGHRLEDLLAYYPEATPEDKGGLVARNAMRVLESELFNALRVTLKNWGYQVKRIQINALDVSDEVKERVGAKLFALWRSRRLAQLRAKEAQAEVSALIVKSEARAYAEAQFIEDLAAEIARLGRTSLDKQAILAVACVNVLNNLLCSIQKEDQFTIPSWVLEQMDLMKRLLTPP